MTRWPDVPPLACPVDDSLDGGTVCMVPQSTVERATALLRVIGATKTPKGEALLGVRFPRLVNAVVAVDILRNDTAGKPIYRRRRNRIP